MGLKINYANIIKRIKEASKIDIETVKLGVSVRDDCPVCGIDPFTGLPTDPNCPSCGGTGVVVVRDTKEFVANVDYISGLEDEHTIGGRIKKGNIIITVITDELESLSLNPYDFISGTIPVDYFEINNIRYDIENVTPGKLQGILYELLIELKPRNIQ